MSQTKAQLVSPVGILTVSGINVSGVVTATSFVGSGSGLTGVGIGSTGSINTSGIITASSFVGALTGTLTNATGLPISGLTSSTSTALGVGSIELGHATDTTLSRSAAGVLAVEGVVIPSISSADTLTNKTLTSPTIASANLTTALTLAGASGTNGQVLTSAGTGLPTWATPSAGALTLLSTVTASASATVDVETTFSSTYDAYMLVISGARPATSGRSLYARMKIGGSYITTSTYISTGGYNSLQGNQETTLATEITLVSSVWGEDALSSCDVVMYIFNPSSTAFKKQLFYQATSLRIDTGATQIQTRSGVGINDNTGALTGIRFFASSGNIAEGTFRLYGIANS